MVNEPRRLTIPGHADPGSGAEPLRPATVRAITIAKILTWVAVAWIALRGVYILLGAFAGVLVALLFDSISGWLRRVTGMPRLPAVTLAILLVTGTVALAFYELGSQLAQQVNALIDRLPSYVDQIRETLERHPVGRAIVDRLATPKSSPQLTTTVVTEAGTALTFVMSALTSVLLVYAVGIFLVVQPQLYRGGLLQLAPDRFRDTLRDLLSTWNHNLRWWLVGQLLVMVLIGVLTTGGLLLLGMPYPLVLGTTAMLLCFVPYLGPISSYLPAAAIALGEGGSMVLWVTLLYAGIQLVESYMITPTVQERIVSLPPALTILFQLMVGILLGIPGLLLSLPLLLVLVVAVKIVYVERGLGRPVELPGR